MCFVVTSKSLVYKVSTQGDSSLTFGRFISGIN